MPFFGFLKKKRNTQQVKTVATKKLLLLSKIMRLNRWVYSKNYFVQHFLQQIEILNKIKKITEPLEETPTPTITPVETPTPTITPVETLTPTIIPVETPVETPTPTITPVETLTPTIIPVETPVETPTPTITPVETPTPTIIPVETPVETPKQYGFISRLTLNLQNA
jgi:hypothetical protein